MVYILLPKWKTVNSFFSFSRKRGEFDFINIKKPGKDSAFPGFWVYQVLDSR